MKIHKTSVASFIEEATRGRTEHPVAYLQVVKRQRNGDRVDTGCVAVVSIEIVLAGWNAQGRVIEWRACVGMAPAIFEDEVLAFHRKGEEMKRQLHGGLEGQLEIREGVLSDEPVYGICQRRGQHRNRVERYGHCTRNHSRSRWSRQG